MGDILGYDCDGNEIEEFRILRFPFSEMIDDWELVSNVDPRLYCAIRSNNGEAYAISVYDYWSTKYIKRYENISLNEEVSMKVLPINVMENYEVAYCGIDCDCWYYEFNRDKLKKKLEKYLKENKVKTKKLKK